MFFHNMSIDVLTGTIFLSRIFIPLNIFQDSKFGSGGPREVLTSWVSTI